MQKNIPLRVKCTFTDGPGTLVTNNLPDMAEGSDLIGDRIITGIAHTPNVTQIKINIQDEEDKPQTVKRIFKGLALANISVDFISVQLEKVLFTVRDELANRAVNILKNMGFEPETIPNCAKVALVGGGIADVPGVMADLVEALADAGIEILQSADSHTTIWVLVKKEQMATAVQALHRKLELGKQ
jgi:aspartate kinase